VKRRYQPEESDVIIGCAEMRSPMNGSIRDASGILMMPTFDCVSQRDLRESNRRRWDAPFAAGFATYDDRFESAPVILIYITLIVHIHIYIRNEIRMIWTLLYTFTKLSIIILTFLICFFFLFLYKIQWIFNKYVESKRISTFFFKFLFNFDTRIFKSRDLLIHVVPITYSHLVAQRTDVVIRENVEGKLPRHGFRAINQAACVPR